MNPRQKHPLPPIPQDAETSGLPSSERHVENYVGFPLEDRLRRRLEDFLAICPDRLSDEEAYAMLIDLGLQHGGELPIARVVENAKRAGRVRRLARINLSTG